MKNPFFSIILPTYKRAKLLHMVLAGLCNQTCSNFEVIVIAKPANDNTEAIVQKYQKWLNIRLFIQSRGYVTHALNTGLRNASGDIICFIDDDAVPASDWLQKHAETYEKYAVEGVAGDALTCQFINSKLRFLEGKPCVPFSRLRDRISYYAWDKPLSGTEGYFIYITRGGTVSSAGNWEYWRKHACPLKSFLGMGANMSVLANAVRDFSFDNSCISGSRWEQILAWHIWKNGGSLVFNPDIVVFHILQGQTLSRNLSHKKATLFQAESELLYYRLRKKEKDLSAFCHALSLLHRTAATLKNKDLARFRGIVVGNYIGVKRFILENPPRHDVVLEDLEKMIFQNFSSA
ncbi:MAG: glycosyltransferase family 2 protein [Candidatus Bathyarchaeia archaeon]